MEESERPAKRLKPDHEQAGGDNRSAHEAPTLQDQGRPSIPDVAPEPRSDTKKLPLPQQAAHLLQSTSETNGDPPLSKNQQKKLRKKQEWEAKREDRKVIRKEKIAAKRERKKEEQQKLIEANGGELPAVSQKPSGPKPVTLPITILIDCDFDNLMRDNERISLASQVTRCYSDNRKGPCRAHLAIASFGGKLKERFETILTHHKSWKAVEWLDEDFVDASGKAKEWMTRSGTDDKLTGAFSKYKHFDQTALENLKREGEVVYLSSESDETLEELKPYSTYIIGGLVDKNREKGICHKRATTRGVRTARLPIGEFMDLQSRKVLATNHVNEIMLKWLECGDWGEAFLKVIPKRKGGKLKGAEEENEDDQDDENVENVESSATKDDEGAKSSEGSNSNEEGVGPQT